MLRHALLASGLFSIVGFVNTATAADLPARAYTKAPLAANAAYNWSGFYLGIEGGGIWGKSQNYWNDPSTPIWHGLPETSGIKPNGALIGGTVGYNYQFSNNAVIGIENDISWTNAKGSAPYVLPFTPLTNIAETSQSWLDTLRGRLGFAWDRWMVFGTGGVAFTDEQLRLCNVAFGCGGQSKAETGWTAGAGVEYAFAGNWSAKLEYLHIDFGSQYFSRTSDTGGGTFHARDVSLKDDIVRAGLNYKFGWGGPVIARY
jgi:outer membrane immunogenic protein